MKNNFFLKVVLLAFILLIMTLLLGRSGESNCKVTFPTKLGVVYVLKTDVSAVEQSSALSRLLRAFYPFVKPSSQQSAKKRTILILPDNSTLTLEVDQSSSVLKSKKTINFSDYQNQKVFATGKLDTCKNTLTILGENDIQPLP